MATARDALLDEFILATAGIQAQFNTAFLNYIQNALQQIEDPFGFVRDPEDGQLRSRLYLFMRETYPPLAEAFVAVATELGDSFYDLRRQQAENGIAGQYAPAASVPTPPDRFVKSTITTKYWTVCGLVKDAVLNGKKLDDVAQAASEGLAEITRSTVVVRAGDDPEVKGHAQIVTRSNACDFCKGIARDVNKAGYFEQKDVKFHRGCDCVVNFTFRGEKPLKQPYLYDDKKAK